MQSFKQFLIIKDNTSLRVWLLIFGFKTGSKFGMANKVNLLGFSGKILQNQKRWPNGFQLLSLGTKQQNSQKIR